MRRDFYSTNEVLVIMLVAAALFFALGWSAGAKSVTIAQCEEDEVWVWEDDFSPPVEPSDLVCVQANAGG